MALGDAICSKLELTEIYCGTDVDLYCMNCADNVQKYIDALEKKSPPSHSSLWSLIEKTGNHPKLVFSIPSKFNLEDRKNKIYALKSEKIRIFCFKDFINGRECLILTQGCNKPKKRELQAEVKKAVRMKEQYFQRKGEI